MPFHPSLLFAGVGALLLSGTALPAATQPGTAAPAAFTAEERADAREITLITGDTVVVTADGKVGFLPGPGRGRIGHVTYHSGTGANRDQYVVPADALGPLEEGVLDERLFDVTDLLADGYADTGALPVIVRDDPGEFDTAAATGGLWDRVVDDRVDHVWLDGRSRVTLAESVPQIGAPAAWESGYTGEGVTVAVLDTGYDPAHPDLAERVKAVKDFSGESSDAVDHYGHGTHVASTVAGSGAASNGKYKGVAPDVDLLVGKVCTDDGYCEDSAIIAGLEWAAANGASVTNLSLGGSPTDGTDPLSIAVNEITERTGMLVVVSAGNYGCAGCVGSPGSADSALTVGSVTKQDTLSDFSSQGPRVGDGAVKPDITAPGSSITAARATGTTMGTPVDDFYTTADGTSMAAPHTTGAVALLKQAHPEWDATRLKAALMGSSKGLEGLSVFEEGAGRVDATDLSEQITPNIGSLSFGMFTFPYAEDPAAKNVTYTNASDTDVELALTVTGDARFTVDSPTVTVPAHGTATVAVSATIVGGTAGNYGAVLTAAGDGVSVRTALGVVLEPEAYDLDIDVDSRAGGPVVGNDAYHGVPMVFVYGLDTDTWDMIILDPDGKGTQRLAPGRYQIAGHLSEGGDTPSMTTFAETVTLAGGDLAHTIDLGAGELVDVDLEADDAVIDTTNEFLRATGPDGQGIYEFNEFSLPGAPSYYVPNPDPGTGITLTHGATYGSPKGAANPYAYSVVFHKTGTGVPGRTTYTVANSELAREDAVYHSQGIETVGRRSEWMWDLDVLYSIGMPDVQVPSRRTEYFAPAVATGTFQLGDAPSGYEFGQYDTTRVAGTRKSVVWGQAPLGVGPVGNHRLGDSISMIPAMYDDGNPEVWGADGKSETVTGTVSLTVNGVETPVEQYRSCWAGAELPVGTSGTFVFTCDSTRANPFAKIGTASSAKWTFHSEPTDPEAGAQLPMLGVRLASPCVANGYAPAGKRQDLTLDVFRTDTTAGVGTRKLTFEVSYDDGKTWKKVTVKRQGDHATATLSHPKGAKFVSTRITAMDADGNAVTQSTTRAWGLK